MGPVPIISHPASSRLSRTLLPALAVAALCTSGAHSAPQHEAEPRVLPQLWAVEVDSRSSWLLGANWVERLRTGGINVLVADPRRLTVRQMRRIESLARARKFIVSVIAPPSAPHVIRRGVSPWGSCRAILRRASRLRCATTAGTAETAVSLVRWHAFVVIRVGSALAFSRLAGRAAVTGKSGGRVIGIVDLSMGEPALETKAVEAVETARRSPRVDVAVRVKGHAARRAMLVYLGALRQSAGPAPNPPVPLQPGPPPTPPAGGDVTPPTMPGGLLASSIQATSLILSWSASTDDVGLAGYQVAVDGSTSGVAQGTRHQVTGLSCERTYAFRVTAVDAAGNVSRAASLTTATNTCPPPAAGVALSLAPTGNDSTCARGDPSRPCATFDRAYGLAQPGDLVEVRGGTYPGQHVLYDSTKTAPNVVFREAAGNTARVGGTLHLGDNTGNLAGAPAQFVTFDGIDMDQTHLHYEGNGIRAQDVTYKNLHLGTKRETGLYAGSTLNLRLENVEFGPMCCEEDASQIAQGANSDPSPSGTVLLRVRYHDIRNSCGDIPPAVWPNCSSEAKPYAGNHVDCLQSTGGNNWTIRDSGFVNCQTGLQLGAEKSKWWNLLIEGNFLFGHHPLNFTCGEACSTHAFRARTPAGDPSYLKVYSNTMASGISIRDVEPGGAYELVGNLVQGASNGGGDCYINATGGKAPAYFSLARHNIHGYGSTRCGPTNVDGTPTYVNTDRSRGPIDLHLRPGSVGVDAAPFGPSSDIDGQTRPCGPAFEIGADELC